MALISIDIAFRPIRLLIAIILLVLLTWEKIKTLKGVLLWNSLFGLLISLWFVRSLEGFYESNTRDSIVYTIGWMLFMILYYFIRKLMASEQYE